MKIVQRTLLSMVFIANFEFNSLFAQKFEPEYLHIALGSSNNFYPKELQEILDDLQQESIITSVDFGIYMSVRKTLIGFALTGSFESYEINGENHEINHVFYAVSILHYPKSEFRNGFYVRGDIGISIVYVPFIFEQDVTEGRFGILLGGGYSWQISRHNRLDALLSYWEYSGENFSTVALNVGILFRIPSIFLRQASD